ncbi:hypothetical protein HN51_001124 [Arachis hypogaea]
MRCSNRRNTAEVQRALDAQDERLGTCKRLVYYVSHLITTREKKCLYYWLTDAACCFAAFHTCLLQVFVPIWEPADAWYLMLLDVKASKIYALDVSRSPESIVRRESNMNKIVRNVKPTHVLVVTFFVSSNSLDDLTFFLSSGLLWGRCSSRVRISLTFATHHLTPQIGGTSSTRTENSDEVRMRAALHVVQSDINRHRAFVQSKAEVVWQGITTSHQKETFNNEGM